MDTQTIKIELTVTETNSVLQALGQMPFAQVAGLIQKIQQQAAPQVAPQLAPTETKPE
jgi:hypothetical protein